MENVSFVIPCYRSEKTIGHVVKEIMDIMENQNEYDYEVILVNDASPDNVWEKITELAKNEKIKGIDLAKNAGQASAVMAGYGNVSGDYVITLDDDGQSPVEATMDIINKLKTENYDVVYGICQQAKFSLFRRAGSKFNSWMAYVMFGRPKDKRIISFCISRRFVIEEMVKYQNPYTYISGLVYRTTGNVGYLLVNHRSREQGTSGYSLKKLIGVWVNGFTAFSVKPLRLASCLGMLFAVLGILMAIIVVIRKLLNPFIAVGWSSVLSAILFIGGVILLVLGLIGEYIGRIYMCINSTPQYVIRQKLNLERKDLEDI